MAYAWNPRGKDRGRGERKGKPEMEREQESQREGEREEDLEFQEGLEFHIAVVDWEAGLSYGTPLQTNTKKRPNLTITKNS